MGRWGKGDEAAVCEGEMPSAGCRCSIPASRHAVASARGALTDLHTRGEYARAATHARMEPRRTPSDELVARLVAGPGLLEPSVGDEAVEDGLAACRIRTASLSDVLYAEWVRALPEHGDDGLPDGIERLDR